MDTIKCFNFGRLEFAQKKPSAQLSEIFRHGNELLTSFGLTQGILWSNLDPNSGKNLLLFLCFIHKVCFQLMYVSSLTRVKVV